jgi:hypothetical protein
MFYCSKQKHGRGEILTILETKSLVYAAQTYFSEKGGHTLKSIEHVEHVEHQQKNIYINIYNNIIITTTYLNKNHKEKTSNLFYM